MADRVDFYFRQRVTEAELDLAFVLLEKADRDLAADLNIYGIVSGAVPAPHSPVPDLTVDLTAPGSALPPCRAAWRSGRTAARLSSASVAGTATSGRAPCRASCAVTSTVSRCTPRSSSRLTIVRDWSGCVGT